MYFSAKVGGAFHLWRQRSPDGRPEQLTAGPSEEEGVAVAADGRSLLTSLGTSHSAIWIHQAGGDREVSGEGFSFVPMLAPTMAQPFSADGRTIFYLVQQGTRFAGVEQRSGALWATDIETGRRTLVLPNFNVTGFDVSRDGTRIVFAALDDTRASHLWLARLDGRLSPRQLSPVDADSPRFGAHGDIFFRMREGAARFAFRMAEDGGEIQKATKEPIVFFMSVSPDGAWLIARVAPEEHGGSAVVAFPARGGPARPVCSDCEADWTPGGSSFVVRISAFGRPQTLVIQVAGGETLPLPAAGLSSDANASTNAAGVGGNRYPGRNVGQYAYMKAAIQRNIYRVPLP
jgi:eukaryotic-like serine/threonine-protein kinase